MPLIKSSHGGLSHSTAFAPDQSDDLNHAMVESEKRFVAIFFCQSRNIFNPKIAKIPLYPDRMVAASIDLNLMGAHTLGGSFRDPWSHGGVTDVDSGTRNVV